MPFVIVYRPIAFILQTTSAKVFLTAARIMGHPAVFASFIFCVLSSIILACQGGGGGIAPFAPPPLAAPGSNKFLLKYPGGQLENCSWTEKSSTFERVPSDPQPVSTVLSSVSSRAFFKAFKNSIVLDPGSGCYVKFGKEPKDCVRE